MAYTEEEKIKILYENSLKDIRDLTTLIGGLVSRIEDANKPGTLLARIDTQIKTLDDLDKKLIRSKIELYEQIAVWKHTNELHIANCVSEGERQLELKTEAQLDVLAKGAGVKSDAEMQRIEATAQKTTQVILMGVDEKVESVMRERVSLVNTSLSETIQEFKDVNEEYAGVVTKATGVLKASVNEVDINLKETVKKHAPLGWLGQIYLIVFGAFVCSLASVGTLGYAVHHGLIVIPTANQVK